MAVMSNFKYKKSCLFLLLTPLLILKLACGDEKTFVDGKGYGASSQPSTIDETAPSLPPPSSDDLTGAISQNTPTPQTPSPQTPNSPNDATPKETIDPPVTTTNCQAKILVSSYKKVTSESVAKVSGTAAGYAGNLSWSSSAPDGRKLQGQTAIGKNSKFQLDFPLFCGQNTLDLSINDASCQDAAKIMIERAPCTNPDLQITLAWDGLGVDFELHLIKEGGSINDNKTDCTWTSCIDKVLDWGVAGDKSDDPKKDLDHLGHFGPENIWLNGPEPGTYTIMVEHWDKKGKPQAGGSVLIFVGQKQYSVKIENLAPFQVWKAAEVTFPEGNVTTFTEIYDCSANWQKGCLDKIP